METIIFKTASAVKKNVIQQQADDFMLHVIKNCNDYVLFMDHSRKALVNYKKSIHAIVFLERLKYLVRLNQDMHMKHCSASAYDECRFTKFYKLVLFYLENEIEFQEKSLPFSYFKKNERKLLDGDIEEISELPIIKMVGRNNYLKFKLEINEMKSYYFLDKKNWKQLFLGKVMVMENDRIINSEQRTAILERLEKGFLLTV